MFEDHLTEIIKEAIKETMPGLVRDAVKKELQAKTLTTSQVEEQYNIDRQKQYDLRKAGVLSYSQDGRTILYPRETIESYVQDHLIKGDY